MDLNRYSVDKLLALRGSKLQSSFERKLLDDAKENQVLTDIMRQRHSLRHRRGNPFLSRSNMEARKSSSAESECNVFIRPQVSQATAHVPPQIAHQDIAPIREKVNQLDGQAGPQLDGQDAEPELPSTEIPQRPTLPDQKRKGFEQFYEAVRSPTHVRVTAGGRIVPNTLDPSHSSPTGKGSKERLPGDINGFHPPFGQPLNGAPFLPGHAMLGPMHPAMHPAFSLMAQAPGAMPPFGGFPMPPFALSQVPSQTAFSHPVSNHKSHNTGEEKKEQEDAAAFAGRSVPMPPFGGQWFLPSHPMMPMGMPFPGAPMMPIGFNPMGQPVLYQHPPTPVSATAPRPFTPAAQPESYPISSIRPSIITKNQLGGLRSSLKKAEAQLAYNRHQIDEKHMEEYARQLRSDIEHFEVKLKGELALEDSIAPVRDLSKDKGIHPIDDGGKALKETSAEAQIDLNRGVHPKAADEHKPGKSRKKDRVKLAVDVSKASAPFINHDVFATNSSAPGEITSAGQPQRSFGADHIRKPSVLPVTAALAPVFQPRSEPQTSGDDDKSINDTKPHMPTVTQAPAEDDKTCGNRSFSGRFHGPIPSNFEESNRYLSSIAPPTPAHDIEEFSNFARDNAGLGLPYLVGEVPFGMDPSPDIRDYIYHRALTQDEEMAKHLFWTDAPEHLRKKFPKFDGKDFYPASPEKQARPKPKIATNLPTGRPEEDFGFSLPAADLDPFAPLEPYRGDVFRATSTRERDMKRATKSDNVTSPMKHRGGNKLRPVAYFNSQGVDESKGSSGSSDNIGETESERAFFNSCVRTWSERVTATATALPGAVTSENAHGFLPQYTIGNAVASLSPAIVKAAGQSSRPSPSKATDGNNLNTAFGLLTMSADGRAENQPPTCSIRIM